MKTCSKCKTSKTKSEFEAIRLECKECVKKRVRKWRMTNTFRKYKKDKCEKCGFVPMHTCQLDVDHIDGMRSNNDSSNLQTLCANCHRLKTLLNNDGSYKRYRNI